MRGTLLSVWPLLMIGALGEGAAVSAAYLCVGLLSLGAGLLVPGLARRVPRAGLIGGAAGLYLLGSSLAVAGPAWMAPLALLSNAAGTATFWVVFSATMLDHVAREDLGRVESTRMLYSAGAWGLGPVTGVLLLHWWAPAPFLLAAAFALGMLLAFRRLDLPEGRGGAGGPPLAYLRRFARRPRLVAGWTFAVVRASGWWTYIVVLPLFCVKAGLPAVVPGAALSLSNALLLLTPLMLRLVGRLGVRRAVRGAFAWCAALFALAGLLGQEAPWAVVLCLLLASAGLLVLDVCGSLPFLMAVKPSERTEMAAVYASFRDVSGIASPTVAGLVMLLAPVAGVFLACGAGLGAAWALAGRLHPRLGRPRGRAP